MSYGQVVQTGIQTLLTIGIGAWAARKEVLAPQQDTPQVVRIFNVAVMRVCLPALQLSLLAVHTDMRHLTNWRLLAAFSLWSLVIQLGSACWSLLFEGGDLGSMGVHALVLCANNTGILAPVVLEAALGPEAAPIGMLATVALYFQQLPVSELLMEAHALSQQHRTQGGAEVLPLTSAGEEELQCRQSSHLQQGASGNHDKHSSILNEQPGGMDAQLAGQEPHQPASRQQGKHLSPAAFLSRLGKNPLVWSTGGAAALSALGSPDWLHPKSPTAPPALGFIEGTLSWLARCSVPVTLLSTGMWLAGGRRGSILAGSTLHRVFTYLGLKLLVLPWVMVLVTRMMGISGMHGIALVLLTCVPVGQTAFVLAEQHSQGTEAVTATLLAGLLLMLPHVLLVMYLIDAWDLYQT